MKFSVSGCWKGNLKIITSLWYFHLFFGLVHDRVNLNLVSNMNLVVSLSVRQHDVFEDVVKTWNIHVAIKMLNKNHL